MKKVILLSLGLVSFLFATTINIPSDYTTIQEGINASVDGDTVLVAQGTYSENLILANEIVLTSHAIYDDLDSQWLDNDNINNTIISGAHNGSCLIVRDGNIQPTVIGLTFQDGVGTSMIEVDCGAFPIRSGGAILLYKAYPTIMYNRFINNGFTPGLAGGGTSVTNGGAISHFADDDVEFDEDRNNSTQNTHSARTIPDEINIQNNYFENNSSGDGKNFYSHGYGGTIDVSHSIFDHIDCASNSVNEYVLKSIADEANYIQNEISGNCIDGNSFYVSFDGDNNNQGTESEPLKTIGHALGLVKDDGTTTTIFIREGVYSPSITGEQFPIVLPDNVHLIGDNRENSILDAEANSMNQRRVIIIEECENVEVVNLTITGGYSEGAGCIGGGGILITNLDSEPGGTMTTSTPVLENLIITDNHSHNGGGLTVFRQSGPTLTNVIVSNNTATAFGGGIFSYVSNITMTDVTVSENEAFEHHGGGIMFACSGGTITNASISNNNSGMNGGGVFTTGTFTIGNTEVSNSPEWTMVNSMISGNSAEWNGGAVGLWDGVIPSLSNVTISGNSAEGNGGGFWVMNSNPTMVDVAITENESINLGGGMFIYGQSNPLLTHCIISNNTASHGGGISIEESNATLTHVTISNNNCFIPYSSYYYSADGGGLHLYYSSPSLTHVEITGNSVGDYGGGMSLTSSNPVLTNVTISGNTAYDGGGIELYDNSDITLVNSIIWDNSPQSIMMWNSNADAAITTYSDIEGGWDGEGNIDANPLFTDANNGDFTLQVGSPCIDAGTADTDGDGDEDITDYSGTAPDMGAFEYSNSVTGLQYTIEGQSVTLTWDPVPDVQYYKLERSTDSEFTTDVESSYLQTNSYTDDDLEFNTEYFYRVSANVNGLWTDYSNVVSVTLEYVNIAGANDIPTVYKVHQNHPNPFNPVTTLRYDLPEDGLVNITVYDVMGRVVRTLVNMEQNAGFKSIQWNATNNEGQPVSAGLYLYTIQAGGFRQTKKMVLLK